MSLGKIWRRFAIPAEAHLESLANSILDAFGFDYDHLYRFTYKNRFGYAIPIHHPYMRDDPPCTDEVQIGDLDIEPGAAIECLYDFGDQWRFQVQLERIDPTDPNVLGPTLVDFQDEAPEQYPSEGQWS